MTVYVCRSVIVVVSALARRNSFCLNAQSPDRCLGSSRFLICRKIRRSTIFVFLFSLPRCLQPGLYKCHRTTALGFSSGHFWKQSPLFFRKWETRKTGKHAKLRAGDNQKLKKWFFFWGVLYVSLMFRDFVISSHRDERRPQDWSSGKQLLDRFPDSCSSVIGIGFIRWSTKHPITAVS